MKPIRTSADKDNFMQQLDEARGKGSKGYQWQGEPVKAEFGWCDVVRKEDKPLWWYNYECATERIAIDKATIPVVQITTTNGYTFMIANHCGIGVHKLLAGGWPNYQHFSVEGIFKPIDAWYEARKAFDLEGFEKHEASRRQWQKENYPTEFEKMENLRMKAQRIANS